MRNIKCTIAATVMASLLFNIAGCSKENEISAPSGSDTTAVQYIAGDPDCETAYYSSVMVTIPQETDYFNAFARGDEAVLLCGKGGDYNQETEQWDPTVWTAYICDYDGNIKSHFELQCDDFGLNDGECVDLGNGTFVANSYMREFVIFDYEGNIVKKGEKTVTPDYGIGDGLCAVDDGFAYLNGFKICKYTKEGEVTDEIDVSDRIGLMGTEGIFEQGGEVYLFGEEMNGDYGYPSFYRFDWKSKTMEKLFELNDIKGGSSQYVAMFESNMSNSMSSYIAEYDAFGYVVEVDMNKCEYAKIASLDRMFIIPPTAYEYDDCHLGIIDKTHYCKVRTNDIGRSEEDGADEEISSGFTEVALISRDYDLNMDNREEIVISGAGLRNDTMLNAAAYYYNMDQNDYYIRLEDTGDKYDFTSPEAMRKSTLNMLAQFSNGEAPDIYYGNYYDYLYFGRNGLVSDMRPYLNESMFASVTPEILRLMQGPNGEIYQVFTSYSLKGFWGQDSLYDNDLKLTSMPKLPDGQERFGRSYTSDLLYDFIGAGLERSYRDGTLTYDNVYAAVNTAVKCGKNRNEDGTVGMINGTADVGKKEVSLVDTYVPNASAYYSLSKDFKDTPVFAGYPSAQGSTHVIEPNGLLALSSSASDPKACCDFIAYFMSDEIQRRASTMGSFPVNDNILQEYMSIMVSPDSASEDLRFMYAMQLCSDDGSSVVAMPKELADSLMSQIKCADSVSVFDWGIYQMIDEEITSYYLQGRSVKDVAKSLESRLKVYAAENYG